MKKIIMGFIERQQQLQSAEMNETIKAHPFLHLSVWSRYIRSGNKSGPPVLAYPDQ